MIRALPLPGLRLPTLPWRAVAFVAYVTVNVYFIVVGMKWNPREVDLALWRGLLPAYFDGTLYSFSPAVPFVWSPVIAPVQGVIGVMGYWPQAALHFAFVAMLRDWRLIVLMLGSFMFWPAIMGGNPLFTLIVVAAWLAWRGSHRWALVFLALSVMIPRPLQLPLMACLLWTRPSLRRPFAVIFVVHAALVVATGYGPDWIAAMLHQGGTPAVDIGPRAFIGDVWMVVALPLAVLLTVLRKPGWAGLMLSPYWLGGYLLFPLIDATGSVGSGRRAPSSPSAHPPARRRYSSIRSVPVSLRR